MQKDFHYHAIAVLAKKAGFSKEDALTIAYASQYVDNSTESWPIKVGDMMFDPVRTAYLGFRATDWNVQKKVYIPFHFIPPRPIRSPDDHYIVEPGSEMARELVDEALKEPPGLLRLCRIGVALHTFADSWAHRGFSGRCNEENDVEAISHADNGGWKHLVLENIYLDFLPQIGHAEAGKFPDQPFLKWKYVRGINDEEVVRDNPSEFLDAARAIYDILVKAEKRGGEAPTPWDDIEGDIKALLAHEDKDPEARCKRWADKFGGLFDGKFEYDIYAWRDDALDPVHKDDTEWDDFKQSDFTRIEFPMKDGFYDSAWVQFHRAALKQRHYVLEKVL
jgi:hypothetical protein